MTPEEAEKEITALDGLTARQLRAKWAEYFGTYCYVHGRESLIRRITWKLRNKAKGGLSQRAKNRAKALHDECSYTFRAHQYHRQPEDGQEACNVIRKEYKGRSIEVRVLGERKFSYNGKFYDNLTAIAWEIAGYQVSGHKFFNLPAKKRHAE